MSSVDQTRQVASGAVPSLSANVAALPRELPRECGFEFKGTAKEYFGIWSVNLALSIVTLGIFSAWAKLRSKQYFFRSTHLDGHTFDYVADPIRILIGRIIIGAILGLMFVAQQYSLGLYLGAAGLLLAASPWLMVKSLNFNARNSTYRRVAFRFRGKMGAAYREYFLASFLPFLSLLLLMPYSQARFAGFVVNHHSYGQEDFKWSGHWKNFVQVYLVMFGMFIGLSLAVGAVVGIATGMAAGTGDAAGSAEPMKQEATTVLVMGVVYVGMIVPAAYARARFFNLIYGKLSIGPHKLLANARFRDWLGLYVTNLLALVFSLGLAIPWAKIRMIRYQASHLTLRVHGSLDTQAAGSEDPNALGDAAADAGALDFDFGV